MSFIPIFLLVPPQFLSSIAKCFCFPVIFSSHFSLLPLADLTHPHGYMLSAPPFLSQGWNSLLTQLKCPLTRRHLHWDDPRAIKLNTSHTNCLVSDLSSGSHVLPVAFPFPSREDICICQFLPQKSVSQLLPSSSSFLTPLQLAQSLGHVCFIS